MQGRERIVPMGFNYYTNPQERIIPIEVARNYPIARDQEEAVRQQIHDIFRTKVFLILQQLQQGNYTATEIRQRIAEQVAVLSPVIGRFNAEVLVPLIRRTYQILDASGALPAPPPTLLRGARVKIEFQGPLAQAQKLAHRTQGVIAGLEFLERLARMFPDSLDNADPDELARVGMDTAGMPQRIIREVPAVEMLRKRRADAMARQQAAQMQAAQSQAAMQNADKLNRPVVSGSMLEAMGKAQAQAAAGGAKAAAPEGAVPGAE